MSYILDALRRADAQRERDPSRGIHAQPAPVPAAVAPRGNAGWLALAGAVVGAGAIAAYLLWQPGRPAPVAPGPPVATAPVQVPATEAPPAPVVATAIQPPAPPMPAPAPVPAPAAQKVAAAPATVMKTPVPAAAAASAGAAPPAAAAPGPAAPGAPAQQRVHALAELPQELQRELPKLQISGSVFSDNAAQRLLIVGGQVVHEGAELAPGVVLEQIRARSAVLKFKGWRYSVTF